MKVHEFFEKGALRLLAKEVRKVDEGETGTNEAEIEVCKI